MINFKDSEFACNCGCGLGAKDMQPKVLGMIDAARTLAGVPFTINRGISCVSHNEAVGGSETSSHLLGWAIDIDCNDSTTRYHMLKALMDVGFTRIGIYKDEKGTFLHADADPFKPSCFVW